jgi:hypothetical protein
LEESEDFSTSSGISLTQVDEPLNTKQFFQTPNVIREAIAEMTRNVWMHAAKVVADKPKRHRWRTQAKK